MEIFWDNQKTYSWIWLDWEIVAFNWNQSGEKVYKSIHNLERETWSFFMWEYAKCTDCWNIMSKNDIYWHLWDEISRQTIQKLEEKFQKSHIKCTTWKYMLK